MERRPITSSSSPACAQRAPASPPASPPPRAAYPLCAVCVADRTPVGPQIAFAQAGGSSQSPSKNSILELRGGRPGGGLAAVWGGTFAVGGPSRVCRRCAACVLGRARWRARWRFVAAEDAPRGRVRCARVRPGWTHPDGGRRVECQCVRVSCARSCVCRVYSTVCGPMGREHSVDVPRRPCACRPSASFACGCRVCMYFQYFVLFTLYTAAHAAL